MVRANDRHLRVSTRLRYYYGDKLAVDRLGCPLMPTQATIYDTTRRRLLCGREDMLALFAAQLKFKVAKDEGESKNLIWVDVSLNWTALAATED